MNSVRTGKEKTVLYHVCREYPKQSKGKLLEIRESNKIIGFKINIYKSIAFPHTSKNWKRYKRHHI